MKPLSKGKLDDLKKEAKVLVKEYVELAYRPREIRALMQMAECEAADAWDRVEDVLTDEAVEKDSDQVGRFYERGKP